MPAASPSTRAAHWFRLVPAACAAVSAALCTSGETRNISLPLAGLRGGNTLASAFFQVKIHRVAEILAQFSHRLAFKGNADLVGQAQHLAPKNAVIGIEFDTGCQPFVRQCAVHGFTPTACNQARISLIWYRLASLPGCGRWACFTPPCRCMATREPAPSTTSPPKANTSDSTSENLMLPCVGLLKIASSVLQCLPLMQAIVAGSLTAAPSAAARRAPVGRGLWLRAGRVRCAVCRCPPV